jgi:hypothetical protein
MLLDTARNYKRACKPKDQFPQIVTIFISVLNIILIFYRPHQTGLIRGCKIFEGYIFHLYNKFCPAFEWPDLKKYT